MNTLRPTFKKYEESTRNITVTLNGSEYTALADRHGNICCVTLEAAAKVIKADLDWSDVVQNVKVLKEAREAKEREERLAKALAFWDKSPIHQFTDVVIGGVKGKVVPTREQLREQKNWYSDYHPHMVWEVAVPHRERPVEIRVSIHERRSGGSWNSHTVGLDFAVNVDGKDLRGYPRTKEAAVAKAEEGLSTAEQTAEANAAAVKRDAQVKQESATAFEAAGIPAVFKDKKYEAMTKTAVKHQQKGLILSTPWKAQDDTEPKVSVGIVGRLTLSQAKRILDIVNEAGTSAEYHYEG